METCYHGVDLDAACDRCAEEMQRQFIPYKTPPAAEETQCNTAKK